MIYSLISNIRRDIFQPIVLYTSENEIIRKLRGEKVSLIRVQIDDKVTSVYRDRIKKDPANIISYAYHLVRAFFLVDRLLRKHKVDILHPHDNLSKIIGGIVGKMAGVKVVVHCHDILSKNNLVEKVLLMNQICFVDRIITVSDAVRTSFSWSGKIPEKVETIYNGIDLEKFDSEVIGSSRKDLQIPKKDTVIGIIAMFDPVKGHVDLFRAIEKLRFQGLRNITCLVVGDGRMANGLKNYVRSRGLEKKIRFLGYRRDIPGLLKIIDIVVMPSLQESFGIVSVEAMAMRVPVIATRVGGVMEVVEDGKTGIIVTPRDIAALCGAIRYLVDKPTVRGEMGEAGRKRAMEKFNILRSIQKTEEIYLNCWREK